MKSKTLSFTSIFTLWIFIFSGTAWADDAQLLSLVRGLQDQMKTMQKTINKQNRKIQHLERSVVSSASETSAPASSGSGSMSKEAFKQMLKGEIGDSSQWLKDLKFKGDFRLRYEAFENSSGSPAEIDDRNRFRFRLRFGWEKKFNPDMKVGFYLASGALDPTVGNFDDPTSTNATFDSNFTLKPIGIDRAFATYKPKWAQIGPIKKFEVTAGKFKNPFEKGSSDLVWDRDVRPEGIYEKFDFDVFKNEDLELTSYATLGQFVLDESGAHPGDASLFAQQLGLNAVFYMPLMEKPVDVKTAVSYYSYYQYTKNSNFVIPGASLARGGQTNGAGTSLIVGDFEIFETYTELAVYPWGVPFKPFFDFTHNAGANNIAGFAGTSEDKAWALGFKLGGIKKKGDWKFSYAYKRVGREALPGFSDSDFNTDGANIGKRGSVFKAAYALTDNLQLKGAAFFINNLNSGLGTAGNLIDQNQNRFQLDLVWKF